MLVSRAAFGSIAVFAVSTLAACGGGSHASSTAATGTGGSATGTGGSATGAGTGGAVFPAADAPQVVNVAPMGPVLTTPRVQLIAYAEDPVLPDVEMFLVELTKTDTWAEQTMEYGVGKLDILSTFTIAGTPPATLDDNTGNVTPFEMTLASNLTGTNPVWGAADQSTIYLFLLPSGTQINSGGLCCDPSVGYFGYHWEAPIGTTSSVPYAVVCNCPGFVQAPLTALDDVTTTVIHELVESATDPLVSSNAAFAQEDDPHEIWYVGSFGGEVADMCQDNTDSNYTPPGSTYMVQRSWSDAAARAGTNPCVPVPPTGPYFNSYPTFPDMVSLTGQALPFNVTTPGVQIAVGQSKTIDVVLHSEAPTSGPWTVTVQDLTAYAAGDPSMAATDVSLDKTSGSDGDVLHLTIKVLSVDSSFGGEGFVLSSTLGQQNNLWFGAVGQ
jgi:hypothetical protein